MSRKEKPVPYPGQLVGSLPIGSQLRVLRRRAGLSLTEMARRLSYTKGYLSNVEIDGQTASSRLVHLYEREVGTSLPSLHLLTLEQALNGITDRSAPPSIQGMPDRGAALPHRSQMASQDQGMPTFGRLLRRLRHFSGLSQERLAEMAGMSAASIAALESGRRLFPHVSTVLLLAKALDASPEQTDALFRSARVSRRSEGAQSLRSPMTDRQRLMVLEEKLASTERSLLDLAGKVEALGTQIEQLQQHQRPEDLT